MTSASSRCLPTMAAGGERGAIEGPERTRCGFSYLAVIGIFPCPIALHEASLWRHLTQYGKQKDLLHPRTGAGRYAQQLLSIIDNTPFLARAVLHNRRRINCIFASTLCWWWQGF